MILLLALLRDTVFIVTEHILPSFLAESFQKYHESQRLLDSSISIRGAGWVTIIYTLPWDKKGRVFPMGCMFAAPGFMQIAEE